MFTLPENPEEDSRKVVDLSETSHILYRLLPWCDPRASAKSTRHLDMSLSDISEVLRTTDKYQMDGLPRQIFVQMWRHVEQEPVRVYAIACRYTAAEWARIVARAAAKQTLKGPITFSASHLHDFNSITATHLQRLFEYHNSCGDVARYATRYLDWLDSVLQCSCTGIAKKEVVFGRLRQYKSSTAKAPKWWLEYLRIAGDCLLSKPCRETLLQEDFNANSAPKIAKKCKCEDTHLQVAKHNRLLADRVEKMVETV